MSQLPLFVSGLDLANLEVNSDLLQLSCIAIEDIQTETSSDERDSCTLSLRYKLEKKSNYTLIAFNTSTLSRKEFPQQDGDLVSSTTLRELEFPIFDFLCSERNRSFSIIEVQSPSLRPILRNCPSSKLRYPSESFFNRRENFFQYHSHCCLQIHDSKTGELLSTPLIVTGNSIGGSVASLFTLWLLDNIRQPLQKHLPPPKLPLCITFGSPFIGNQGLQQAILESSRWNSCFLHVVGNKDLFPRTSFSHNDTTQSATEDYKAFGTFILCSEKGCACVDDLEVVPRLLESTKGHVTCEAHKIDYYVGIVNDLKSKSIIRGSSQLDLSYMQPLKAGIILKLEAIGVEMNTQQEQLKEDNNNLISKLEETEKVLMAERVKSMDSIKKLNQIKIKMVHLEWYKKVCKTKGIGYYDCYKSQLGSSNREVTRLKKFLTNYWKDLVKRVDRKPQKEGAFIRAAWLNAGRNYRRMVEPLDIAEYYRENGKRDYQTHGRSRHYILLEQWHEEDDAEKLTSYSNKKKKQDVAGILTEDSCFWAKVEDALISCKFLMAGTSSAVEKQSAKENLDMFEQYAMDQINNFAVSPEIFLEQSSFMKWWKKYQDIIETSHDSPLSDYMKNDRHLQYEKASTFFL